MIDTGTSSFLSELPFVSLLFLSLRLLVSPLTPLPSSLQMIANVIAVSTLSTAGRYGSFSSLRSQLLRSNEFRANRVSSPCSPFLSVAMCLMPASFYSSAIVTLSWISGSASGSAVKRACVLSLIVRPFLSVRDASNLQR